MLKALLRPHWSKLPGTPRDIYWLCRQIRRIKPVVTTILDIGASVGVMTNLFARTFPEATIHAFEPQSASRMMLRENTRHYDGRVSIHPCGLYDADVDEKFHLYAKPESSSLLPIQQYMMHDNRVIGTEWVHLRTLDDWAMDFAIEHIDLMKIDVEGVELEVLAGGPRTLRKTETVYVEISPLRKGRHARDHIDVFQSLQDAGLTFVGYFGDFLFSRNEEIQNLG